jgi:hypothetical protein
MKLHSRQSASHHDKVTFRNSVQADQSSLLDTDRPSTTGTLEGNTSSLSEMTPEYLASMSDSSI